MAGGAIGKRVAVDSSAAVKLVGKGRAAFVRNAGPNTVYLGGTGVTSATGYALAANAELPNDYVADIDELYGICAAAETASVHVLAYRTREAS